MTCPRWQELVRRRDEAAGGAGAGLPAGLWARALAHLDECSVCRPAALAADPSLVFRSLPVAEVGDDDVAAMRERVRLLRRARELEAIESPASSRRSPLGSWLPRVSAAILLVGTLTGVGFESRLLQSPALLEAGDRSRGPVVELPAALVAQPVLEEADRPFSQVVEWTNDDLALVVLVDERLDV